MCCHSCLSVNSHNSPFAARRYRVRLVFKRLEFDEKRLRDGCGVEDRKA
jgi:hypothetical protein